MAGKSPKCSELHTRDIYVPDCVRGVPCTRTYHVFLPRILCRGADAAGHTALPEDELFFAGKYDNVGTLPMAFLLHGFGEDSRQMLNFMLLAETFDFVLVLPEGLENSFNAGDCCGYAVESNVDDVGLLSQIQNEMIEEFDFLRPNFAFGIGVNNGAFLLTHALERSPRMFQSVVLISGYTHRVDEIRSKMGMGGNGIGLMVHHSLDDLAIRPSGCCSDRKLPKCHGDVEHSGMCKFLFELHFSLYNIDVRY